MDGRLMDKRQLCHMCPHWLALRGGVIPVPVASQDAKQSIKRSSGRAWASQRITASPNVPLETRCPPPPSTSRPLQATARVSSAARQLGGPASQQQGHPPGLPRAGGRSADLGHLLGQSSAAQRCIGGGLRRHWHQNHA
jgi:hypothetical protein